MTQHRARSSRGKRGPRATVASEERARIARAIADAIHQISLYDPALAEQLTSEIKSGKVFAHIPKVRL